MAWIVRLVCQRVLPVRRGADVAEGGAASMPSMPCPKKRSAVKPKKRSAVKPKKRSAVKPSASERAAG